MEPPCLFDAPSGCFPTVSLPPSLFLFAAQYLSAFHPLFSLCLPSLSYLSLSLFAFLLFSLSVSLSERGCGIAEVDVVWGQREGFFFIGVLLSELAHQLGYTHICTQTHTHKHTPKTSNTRQMLTNNSESLAENWKAPEKLGPTVHNSYGELRYINHTLPDKEQNSKSKNINKTIMAQTSETDCWLLI